MTNVASFLGREMTDVEEATLRYILRDEITILPCKYTVKSNRGRIDDIIEAIPVDCDVVIVKTHIFISRWLSEATNLIIINHKSQFNNQHQKVFTGWRVFKNGQLRDVVKPVLTKERSK